MKLRRGCHVLVAVRGIANQDRSRLFGRLFGRSPVGRHAAVPRVNPASAASATSGTEASSAIGAGRAVGAGAGAGSAAAFGAGGAVLIGAGGGACRIGWVSLACAGRYCVRFCGVSARLFLEVLFLLVHCRHPCACGCRGTVVLGWPLSSCVSALWLVGMLSLSRGWRKSSPDVPFKESPDQSTTWPHGRLLCRVRHSVEPVTSAVVEGHGNHRPSS